MALRNISAVAAALTAAAALAWPQTAGPLPGPARTALESVCAEARLAPAAPQISHWFRQDRIDWEPSFVEADFNGDGRRDFAVQVLCRAGDTARQRVVALVAREDRFTPHMLAEDPPDSLTFLVLYRKGEKDFDFEAMKPFRYADDALGVLYFYKTAMTFRWTGNGFRKRAAPGDEEVEAQRADASERPSTR